MKQDMFRSAMLKCGTKRADNMLAHSNFLPNYGRGVKMLWWDMSIDSGKGFAAIPFQ